MVLTQTNKINKVCDKQTEWINTRKDTNKWLKFINFLIIWNDYIYLYKNAVFTVINWSLRKLQLQLLFYLYHLLTTVPWNMSRFGLAYETPNFLAQQKCQNKAIIALQNNRLLCRVLGFFFIIFFFCFFFTFNHNSFDVESGYTVSITFKRLMWTVFVRLNCDYWCCWFN